MSIESRPLARQPLFSSPEAARRGERVVGGEGETVDGTDDLRVRRLLLLGRRAGAGDLVDVGVVLRVSTAARSVQSSGPARARRADGSRRPRGHRPRAGGQVLDGVEGGRVEPDDRTDSLANTVHDPVVKSCSRDRRPAPRRPRPPRVGRGAAVEPMGPALSRCADSSVALPPPSPRPGCCAARRRPQLLLGEGVVDTAAGDDQRLRGLTQHRQPDRAGPRPVAAAGSHGPPSRRCGPG